jgi:release factor glutamine methyltransferase
LETDRIASGREAGNVARWVWEDMLQKQPGMQSALLPEEMQRLESAIQRLRLGEPIQYIAGHAWFYGKRFTVNRDVLIPRPETEELVEWVYNTYRDEHRSLAILDIGTGSGCIAITLQLLFGPTAKVTGIDVSANALSVAERNNDALGTNVSFKEHDFLSQGFSGLGKFDIIVSNPPYIAKEMVEPKVIAGLQFEPDLALYPEGGDPDIFYKKIIGEAGDVMPEGGHCFMEINEFRKEHINDLLCNSTIWSGIVFRKDLQGQWRMLRIRR